MAMSSSLCLKILQPLLLHLWQLCALEHHPSIWLLQWFPAVGLAALGQHVVVLSPQLIWRDTMRVPLSLPLCHSSNNCNPRCLLRHMPIKPWALLRWVFSFRSELPTDSICCILVLDMVFSFYFQITIWLPCYHQWGLNHWVCSAATL